MGKNTLQAILCGVVLLICCQWVQAHGFLSVPPSRNLIANRKGQEYCHHCLSAGGPSTCQSLTPGGLYPSPTETTRSAVRSNLCGEAANLPASARKYNPSPVPVLSTLPVYQAGQEFDMEITITVHHRGHYEFRVCDASQLSDPTTVTWECLAQNLLERVPVPGEISPVDVNHPERYYLEPECAPGYNAVNKMRYKMPANLNCERCVLQWWWITANTCNPPGYAQRSPQPAHVASGCNWWQSNLPVCSTAYPEEFWNCADIRVNGTGQSTGPVQPASGNNQPKPAPAPVAVEAPQVPEVAPQAPPPAVPQTPGVCRPCSRDDGAQCTHPGAASVSWCNANCPAGVNDAWCPPSHCYCAPSDSGAPTTPPATPPAQPVAPPPTKPVSPPPAQPIAPPPTKPVSPPPAQPVAPPPAKPVSPPPAKPVSPPPSRPVSPPPAQSSNCAALGWQCGGDGWTGPNCCSQGQCMAYIYSYSQCRNDCPAGWLCNSSEKSLLTQAVDAIKNLF